MAYIARSLHRGAPWGVLCRSEVPERDSGAGRAMQAVLHPLSQALLLAPLLSSAPRLGSGSVLGAHHWQQHEWQRHRGLQHGAAPAPAQRAAVVRMAGVSGEESGEELQEHVQEGGSLARPMNLYVEQIQNISAPELIKGFAETAPAEV